MSAIINPGAAGASKAGGSDKQVQFNDAGAFGGDSKFTYDKASGIVRATTAISAGSNPAQNSGALRIGAGSGNGLVGRNWMNTSDQSILWINSSDYIVLGNGNPIELQGLVSVAGGKLQFPTSQSPSSDPYTLDDYRENTFTPTIGAQSGESGQTYALQFGEYQKIGRRVFFSLAITLASKGTLTGPIFLKGLPFSADQTGLPSPGIGGVTVGFYRLAKAVAWIGGYVYNNSIQLVVSDGTGLYPGYPDTTWIANDTSIYLSGHYRTAN